MFPILQEELEIVFMVVFTTEMMTKILALGFVLHKEQSPTNSRHVKLNVNESLLGSLSAVWIRIQHINLSFRPSGKGIVALRFESEITLSLFGH